MMRRVFYFAGWSMKVYEWRDKELLGSHLFDPNEEGIQLFTDFLAHCVSMPAQLLVDVIEEDFRRESIPHLSGHDRKMVLQRLIDRHYRGQPYVHIQSLGRIKTGRRDDQVMLSSLATIDLLTDWVDKIEKANIPLAGIWSVPLLQDTLLKKLGAQSGHKLLVSRQVKSAIRETYFKDGKLVFSRQAKLEPDKRDDESVDIFLYNLEQETEQTHRFLTNQRIMGFADKLQIICIAPDAQLEAIRAQSRDTNAFKYQFFGLKACAEKLRFDVGQEKRASVIYAFLCSQAPLNKDHYASPPNKRAYRQFLLARAISQISTVGSLVIATGAAFLALHSLELKQQSQQIKQDQILLEQLYQRDFQTIEQRIADAQLIHESVKLAHELEEETGQTPQRFFGLLSNLLSDARYNPIQPLKIEWRKQYPSELVQTKELIRASKITGEPEATEEAPAESESLHPQALIRLNGRLNTDGIPYRETASMMKSFSDALSTMEGVEGMTIVQTPVDIRPNGHFRDAEGTVGEDTRDADRNDFEILILLKAVTHESIN